MRLTHAEIYLNNLKSNIKNIRSLLKPKTKICAAVKANAYGNGAVRCAKAAVEAGASFLAVATVSEGIELRNAGIETPVLLLSLCSPPEIEDVVKYSITPLVFDKEFINLLDYMRMRASCQSPFSKSQNHRRSRWLDWAL